jgi:vitamin B12 transporter
LNVQVVMRLLLSVSLLLLLLLSQAQAQSEDSMRTYELQDIVIQENRLQIAYSDYAKNIDIITKKDIEKIPVNNLFDVLSYVPGLDVRRRGVGGVQADLSIRGSTFDETLVLLNGIKLSDPQTGHHLMNLPFDLNTIERVEVLRGSSARIFGQNAFAGAVNIITKVPDENYIQVSSFAGVGQGDSRNSDTTYYDSGVGVNIAYSRENFGQFVSINHQQSNGYRYNSDYDLTNVFYQSYLKALGGKFNIQAGYSAREFGANGFYFMNREREKINTALAAIEYNRTLGDKISIMSRAYFRSNKDNYLLFFDQPEVFHNVHLTNVWGGEIHSSFNSDLGVTGFGLEIRNESIEGVEEEQLATNPLLNDDSRLNAGFFLDHHFEWGVFDVIPGFYLNWHQDYSWQLFPGLDIGVQATPWLRFFANAGKTYRVPTFFDLYYASAPAKTFGDPDLRPGEAWIYEAGIQTNFNRVTFDLNYFHQQGINTIDWVNDPDNEDVIWQARNFSNVQKNGVEASLTWSNPSPESFDLKGVNVNYTYLDSYLQNNRFTSRYAISHFRHKFVGNASFQLIKNVDLAVAYRYFSRPEFDDESLLAGLDDQTGYHLLDAKLNYRLPKFSLFVQADNLLDSYFIEVAEVPMPGRWFRAGVQYQFGL